MGNFPMKKAFDMKAFLAEKGTPKPTRYRYRPRAEREVAEPETLETATPADAEPRGE